MNLPANKPSPPAKTGRKLLFPTPEILQQRIEEYFQDADERDVPYTISGLGVFLKVDRTTIVNYGHRDPFFNTVKEARRRVERDQEERMLGNKGSTIGQIFSLKNNFGWLDKTEVTHKMETVEDKLRNLAEGRPSDGADYLISDGQN